MWYPLSLERNVIFRAANSLHKAKSIYRSHLWFIRTPTHDKERWKMHRHVIEQRFALLNLTPLWFSPKPVKLLILKNILARLAINISIGGQRNTDRYLPRTGLRKKWNVSQWFVDTEGRYLDLRRNPRSLYREISLDYVVREGLTVVEKKIISRNTAQTSFFNDLSQSQFRNWMKNHNYLRFWNIAFRYQFEDQAGSVTEFFNYESRFSFK